MFICIGWCEWQGEGWLQHILQGSQGDKGMVEYETLHLKVVGSSPMLAKKFKGFGLDSELR